MPPSESNIPDKGQDQTIPVKYTNLLSLNELFRESMKLVQLQYGQLNTTTRCDGLPTIRGEKEEIRQLFEMIISMIFLSKHSGPKHFLYVDCVEDESKKDMLPNRDGWKIFEIRFNTNIIADEAWLQKNENDIARCNRIVSSHNAIFAINHINHKGCLCSIAVPGKFQ
jgi:hypothetical protein